MFNNYTPEERQRLLEEQDGLVNSINSLKGAEAEKNSVLVELDKKVDEKQLELAELFDKIDSQTNELKEAKASNENEVNTLQSKV